MSPKKWANLCRIGGWAPFATFSRTSLSCEKNESFLTEGKNHLLNARHVAVVVRQARERVFMLIVGVCHSCFQFYSTQYITKMDICLESKTVSSSANSPTLAMMKTMSQSITYCLITALNDATRELNQKWIAFKLMSNILTSFPHVKKWFIMADQSPDF